jgi:hypothetical protein
VVTFPLDQKAFKAVNDFLAKNPHLIILQQAFSFREELSDDVLFARAIHIKSLGV